MSAGKCELAVTHFQKSLQSSNLSRKIPMYSDFVQNEFLSGGWKNQHPIFCQTENENKFCKNVIVLFQVAGNPT